MSAMAASVVTIRRLGRQDPREDRVLILRTAAHAEAGRLETNARRVEAGIPACRLHTFSHAAFQACPSLACRGMVARPSGARAENAPGFVPDDRFGTGLASIHS